MGYKLTDEDKHLLNDVELQKLRMSELLNQQEKVKRQHWTVKLPCHGESYELPKSQSDTFLICSVCGKRYKLAHSAVGNKLYTGD